MEVIDGLLQTFSQALRGEVDDSTQSLNSLVETIASYLFSDLEESEFESATSMLFGTAQTPSILSILRDASNSENKNVIHGKEKILQLVTQFIKRKYSRLVSLIGPFVDELIVLYEAESRSIPAKSYLLLPIKEILKVLYKRKNLPATEQGSFVVAAHQAISSHLEKLYHLIYEKPLINNVFSGGSNPSYKSDLFIVIGLLYANFPTNSESLKLGNPTEKKSKLMKDCWHFLKKEMGKGEHSSTEKPNMTLIAGLVSCLDRLLFHLDLETSLDPSSSSRLFKMNLQVINLLLDPANPLAKSHRPVVKCLRLFKNHFDTVFVAEVQKDGGDKLIASAFDTLSKVHGLHKKALLKHDEGAVIGLIKLVKNVVSKDLAVDISAGTRSLNDKMIQVLLHFKAKYLETINFQPVSAVNPVMELKSHIVLLAVRGLATIAPALAKVEHREAVASGSKSRVGIIDALVRAASMLEFMKDQVPEGDYEIGNTYFGYNENAYASENSAMTKTAYFLLAIGGTMASTSATCNSEVIEYVSGATDDVIQGYPSMSPSSKLLSRKAICLLCQGLAKRSAEKLSDSSQAALFTDYLNFSIPKLLLNTITRQQISSNVAAMGATSSNADDNELADYDLDDQPEQPNQDDSNENIRSHDMLFGNGRMVGTYVGLWLEMLVPVDADLRNSLSMNNFPYGKNLAPRILSRLFAESITMLRSLNLKYNDSLPGSENVIIPENPVDHDLLLNLSTFFRQILVVYGSKLTDLVSSEGHSEWLCMFALECVQLSEEYPDVSALYRLIQSICSTSLLTDQSTGAIIREYFFRLEPKLAKFADELLEAVLTMLLDAHPSILPFDALVPSIVVAFSTGKQALQAVETLERRFFNASCDGGEGVDLSKYLPQLLPLLDRHLTFAGSQGDKAKGTIKVGNRSTVTSLKSDAAGSKNNGSPDTTRAIVRLLGRLGGNNQYILRSPQEAVQSSLSWPQTDCIVLNLAVPNDKRTSEINLSLTLDRLLPRIVELCSSSNSEATLRVTAAESLHAMILFLLGKASQTILTADTTSPNASIYEKVFPAVIELAVGSGVMRVLFEKLLFQIVRWFSGNKQVHSSEVAVLIEVLLTGLCDINSGGTKDICATAVAAFYQYALKQGTKKENAMTGTTSEMLLNRLFSLCAHPSEDTRMGAVNALGRMYKPLREETSHITLYAMQIVYTLLRAMRLNGSNRFLDECGNVVKHYSSIVAKKLAFEGGCSSDGAKLVETVSARLFPQNLNELVVWLWEGFGSPVKIFRRQCMITFELLCPFLIQYRTRCTEISSKRDNDTDRKLVSEFFKVQLSEPMHLIQNLEMDSVNQRQLDSACPEWDGIDGEVGLELQSWLLKLIAMLDSYIRLVVNKFVKLETIFPNLLSGYKKRKRDGLEAPNHSNYSSSVILECIASFASTFWKTSGPLESGVGTTKEALLLVADVEQARQEVLEKSLWFLSECFKLQHDLDHQRAFALLMRKTKVWDTAFQDLFLLYLIGPNNVPCVSNATVDIKSIRIKDISGKMAEEFLTFLPLLEEEDGPTSAEEGKMDVVPDIADMKSSGQFSAKLSSALNIAVDKLPFALEKKQESTILGLSRTLKLLIRLHRRSENEENIGILRIIWGEDYENTLRQTAMRLVEVVATTVLKADPLQLDCGMEYLLLALDLGFSFVDPPTGLPLTKNSSLLRLLIPNSSASNVSNTQSLVKFVDQFGDFWSRQMLELQFKISYDKIPQSSRDHLISSICDGGTCGLPMRIFSKVLILALSEQAASTCQTSLVMACSSNFCRFPIDILLLILELDCKVNTRSMELQQFVKAEILSKISSNLPTYVKLIPYVLCGSVKGCPRPISEFNDDPDFVKKLLQVLEVHVAKEFPLESRAFSNSSTPVKMKKYSVEFHSYLDTFAATGSPVLLRALLPSLLEGSKHIYYSSVEDCLSQVVRSIPIENTAETKPKLDSMEVDKPSVYAVDPGKFLLLGCLELVLDSSNLLKFKSETKWLVLSGLCLPILKRLSLIQLVDYACMPVSFYGTNNGCTTTLIKCLVDSTQAMIESSALTTSEADSLITTRSSAYSLIETIFDFCLLPSLKDQVNIAFNSNGGTSLSAQVIKYSYEAVRYISNKLSMASDAAKFRFQSSAFCCLALVITKTQSGEEKVFNKYVLSPEKKNDDGWHWHWKNVIDPSISLEFTDTNFETKILRGILCSESDAEMMGSIKVGNIYKRGKERRRGSGGLMTQFAGTMAEHSSLTQGYGYNKAKQFSQSQRAAASQRSDTYAFDNSTSLEQEEEKGVNAMEDINRGSAFPILVDSMVRGLDDQVLEIELKDFNTTPAMAALLRLVTRLHSLYSDNWTVESPPVWVSQVIDFLSDSNLSVRIFFLRFVLNMPVCAILRKWSQLLLCPILKVTVKDLCNQNLQTLHYVIRDVIYLFTDRESSGGWSQSCTPRTDEEIIWGAKLFTALVERTYSTKTKVLRINLRVFGFISEEWLRFDSYSNNDRIKTRILHAISLQAVVDFMNVDFVKTGGHRGSEKGEGAKAFRTRLAGLELLRIFLLTKGPILEVDVLDSGRKGLVLEMLQAVLSCIEYKRKEVYEAGCLLCGTILKILSIAPRSDMQHVCTLDDFKGRVMEKVKKWYTAKDGYSCVATCLNAIASNYPLFIDSSLYLNMAQQVRSLKPRSKFEFLKALYCSTSEFDRDRPLTEELKRQWPDLLTDLSTVSFGAGANRVSIPCIQLYSLKILSKRASDLSLDLLELLFGITRDNQETNLQPMLTGLSLAVNDRAILQVREEAYNLLISICTNHREVRIGLEIATSPNFARIKLIRAKAMAFLLKGITDPDTDGLEELQSTLIANAAHVFATEQKTLQQDREARLKEILINTTDCSHLPVSADEALRADATGAPKKQSTTRRVGIRRKVLDYFSLQYGLSRDPFIRLVKMMREPLFDPAFVDQWLNYTSYLMLSVCKDSATYTKPIFDNSLVAGFGNQSPMPLREVSSTSSRISSVPRFSLEVSQVALLERARTATTASQRNAASYSASQISQFVGFTQSSDMSQRVGGFLRATQQFSWTQTQAAGVGESGGLLPGQFRSDQIRSQDNVGFTQVYLTTEVTAVISSRNVANAPIASGAQEAVANQMLPPENLPRWVVTSQRRPSSGSGTGVTKSTDFVSLGQLNGASSALGSAGPPRPSSKTGKTVVYRKYRDGELPDIGISHADILQPLQALCLRDEAVASGFLGLLFESIYTADKSIFSVSSKGLRTSLLGLLETSAGCVNTALVSTLLSSLHLCLRYEANAAINNRSADFDPLVRLLSSQSVADRALHSLNFHAGISLLEEQIIGLEKLLTPNDKSNSMDVDTASLGTGCPMESKKQEVWRDLGRLYEGLGDRDVLLGLAARMSQNSFTQRALELELSRDYNNAGNMYKKLLTAGNEFLMNTKMAKEIQTEIQAHEVRDDGEAVRYEQLMDAAKLAEEECGVNEISCINEMRMWSVRALEASRQLCCWKEMRSLSDTLAGLVIGDEAPLAYGDDPVANGVQYSLLDLFSQAGLTENPRLRREMRDHVLPSYIHSLLGSDQASNQELEAFLNIVTRTSSDFASSELRQAVESRHAAELAAALAFHNNWPRVRLQVEESYFRFTRSWSSLHPCAWQARCRLLQGLGRVCELDDAAHTRAQLPLRHASNSLMQEQLSVQLSSRWASSAPSLSDPLWVWDEVIKGRLAALWQDNARDNLHKDSLAMLSRMHALTAAAAVQQNIIDRNFITAHLKKSRKFQLEIRRQTDPSEDKKMRWTFNEAAVVAAFNFRSIERTRQGGGSHINVTERNKAVDENMTNLKELFNNLDAEKALSQWERDAMDLRRAEWYSLGLVILRERKIPIEKNEQNTKNEDARKAYLKVIGSEMNIETELPHISQQAEMKGANNQMNLATRASAAGGLAKLSLFLLQGLSPVKSEAHVQAQAVNAIQAFLCGLRLGSRYCRANLMPFFNLVGCFPEAATEARVSQGLRALPPWIFLTLISPMFGCLDRSEGPVVMEVLEAVAERYPNALHYPVRVTSPCLASHGRELIGRLEYRLRNPSIDAFIEALGGLTHPELRYQDAIKDMMKLASMKDKKDTKTAEQLQKRFLQMRQELEKSEWEHVGTKIGKYNASIASKLRKLNISAIVGEKGEKLMELNKARGLVDKLRMEYSKPEGGVQKGGSLPHGKNEVDLGLFSQWLEDFDASRHRLEVPGQYLLDADRPPAPERHALIVSFSPRILVLPSIRKPKRLKIHGSGGVDSLWLVKGGEDLRNDERVQQLFGLMNDIVGAKTGVGETFSAPTLGVATVGAGPSEVQGLQLRTYIVVPMTLNVGILEWVGNTKPLKSVVIDELKKDKEFCRLNQEFASARSGEELQLMEASKKREAWLNEGVTDDDDWSTTKTTHKRYLSASKESRADIEAVWDSVAELVPTDTVRRHLLGLAPAPECYLTLRSEFSRSLAMINVCGYLLGLGDRHMDNLLLDKASGSIVPIDFGICFGIGAALLPVPELIPFRLSPALRDVLLPLDGRGLLRHFMVQALSRLRAQDAADVLSTRLEGYVSDPLMDWINLREKEDKQMLIDRASSIKFEPRRRIEVANRKLNGEHPGILLCEDLQENNNVRGLGLGTIEVLQKCVHEAVIDIGMTMDITQAGAEKILTPAQQVDALLALATDKGILLRSYPGLAMWL